MQSASRPDLAAIRGVPDDTRPLFVNHFGRIGSRLSTDSKGASDRV